MQFGFKSLEATTYVMKLWAANVKLLPFVLPLLNTNHC
jgi:hypothetical protein